MPTDEWNRTTHGRAALWTKGAVKAADLEAICLDFERVLASIADSVTEVSVKPIDWPPHRSGKITLYLVEERGSHPRPLLYLNCEFLRRGQPKEDMYGCILSVKDSPRLGEVISGEHTQRLLDAIERYVSLLDYWEGR
jgi:hypothetical protein